jgi:hypothetical protein
MFGNYINWEGAASRKGIKIVKECNLENSDTNQDSECESECYIESESDISDCEPDCETEIKITSKPDLEPDCKCKDISTGKNKVRKMFIKRVGDFNPIYKLYSEDDPKTLVLVAIRKFHDMGRFVISKNYHLDKWLVENISDDVIGCLETNFTGSKWYISDEMEETQGVIRYNSFLKFGITLEVPFINESGEKVENQSIKYINRTPNYNSVLGMNTLEFNRRATRASCKNSILENTKKENMVLVGRVDTDKFSLDITDPITDLQAFAFAIAKIAWKFGVN